MKSLAIKYSEILFFILILLIVFITWYAGWHWIDAKVVADNKESTEAMRGQFGDKFGAVNALFSGFAFAGIIFTILLQRKDLSETRNAMSHERFDNTFFQLLKLHINIASKIEVKGHSGQDAFTAFYEHIKSSDNDFHAFCALQKISRDNIREIIDTRTVNRSIYKALDDADVANLDEALGKGLGSFNNYLDNSIEMHKAKIIKAYTASCIKFIDYFSHYFRNLYHILKFIDESILISDVEKKSYAKFVRSQLSEIELISIFYNSLGKIDLPRREAMELGYPKMAKLIQKYDILQNMNPLSIIHPVHHTIFTNNNGGTGNAN